MEQAVQTQIEEQLRIRPWCDQDRQALQFQILQFLKAQGDLAVTARNADLFFQLGLGLAKKGDPTLLASISGYPVGWVCWGEPETPFEARWKTCHTFGSYTASQFRHAGISLQLRDEAWHIAERQGYERIIGPVQVSNKRGLRLFKAGYGAKATSVQFEFFLSKGKENGTNHRNDSSNTR